MYNIPYNWSKRIYDGFLFRIKRVLSADKKPVISNTGNFFCFNNTISNLYNNDVIIYRINKKSWEQFCLWMSLPNFRVTALVKFLKFSCYNIGQILKIFVKITAKTATCKIGLYLRPLASTSNWYNRSHLQLR